MRKKIGRKAKYGSREPVFYPIMAWNYETHSKILLQGMADANFNTVGFIRPASLPRLQKTGLKAIMVPHSGSIYTVRGWHWRKLSGREITQKVRQLIGNTADNESVLGYFLSDEPSAKDFVALGKAVRAVKKYAPGKLAYINLYPSYAVPSQLGTKTYSRYLKDFVEQVRPQFISYDNYSVQYSVDLKNEKEALNYYKNLLAVRQVALQHNLPYWNVVASRQLRHHKKMVRAVSKPSLANMLFQAYTSLAAGYDGISWFTYSPHHHPPYNVYSPVDNQSRKTKTWNYISKVNGEVSALGPLVGRLSSTGVYFSNPAPNKTLPKLPGKVIKSVHSSTPLMVGEFVDKKGNAYALFVNLSLKHAANFMFTTQKAMKQIWIFTAGARDKGLIMKKAGAKRSDKKQPKVHQKLKLRPGAGKLVKFGY